MVYLARDPVIGRVVALKTINIPDGTPQAVKGDSLERFSREARAAGLLSHPNIVTIYDVGTLESDGSSYIAMEFVEGRTLRQLAPYGERMEHDGVLDVVMQVARALDYAHRRGIVHRDVKPANILVREDGLVKLADFGVARIESSDLTRTGQSVGSPSYIAPEMLSGQPTDGRADLFSLGVIVYELLTGAKPFQGETLAALYHQILSVDPAPPTVRAPELAPEWDAIVMKMLAKRPEDRHPSAAHLLEDLRRMERGRPLVFSGDPSGTATGPGEQETGAALPEPVPERVIEQGAGDPRGAHAPMAPQVKAVVAFSTMAGFALVVILVAVFLRTADAGLPAPPPDPANAAATVAGLRLTLSHNLKAGRIGVTMDGAPILTESFRGERARMRMQGAFTRTVEVPAGRHVFKVTVADDEGRSWSGVVFRDLAAHSESTLAVEVKGLLKKNLELTWR